MNDNEFSKLKTFLVDELTFGNEEIDDETPLFTSRIISSLNLIRLISYLDSEFRVKVTPPEITTTNFDTLAGVRAFVTRKRSQSSRSVA